ncbi:MAG: beta/gamma crystallin-related protein [Alphaproteobacteria bacterium]
MRAPLLGVLALFAATPALGSEVVLFDNANCAGPQRTLIDSEADLDRVEFGNDAASVLVVAGTWTFYRDDNFQSANGPPVTLGPGGCVTMGTGPAAAMPPDLMDSVQLVQPAPGPGAAIVLYDQNNFQGVYRVLTGNAPDLDAVEFDNRLNSFQVLAGAWRIFRDDGFQSGNGPPLDAFASAPSVDALGFPGDRASSVMRLNVASDPPPQPPVASLECPPGSATNGAVCVDCGGMGLAVAGNGGSCVCPPGESAVGSRTINGIAVALCQSQLAVVTPPASQCAANEVFVGSQQSGGGCVPCPPNSAPNAGGSQCQCVGGTIRVGDAYYNQPECAACDFGSVYDASTGRCVCPAGTSQASTDGRGMPMCVAPQARRDLVEIPANEFYYAVAGLGVAPVTVRAGGSVGCNYGAYPHSGNIELTVETGIAGLHGAPPPANPAAYTCSGSLFAIRLQNGWQFHGLGGVVANSCGVQPNAIARLEKRNADPADMTHDYVLRDWSQIICYLSIGSVILAGPVGQHWKTALGY